ncbi:MAG: hypothetical protein WAO07_12180 [Desulfobacterales bacterium]
MIDQKLFIDAFNLNLLLTIFGFYIIYNELAFIKGVAGIWPKAGVVSRMGGSRQKQIFHDFI